MEWHLLPQEMRSSPQWVCADDKKKLPINPSTGEHASVDDPSSWGTFEQATRAAVANGWEVGFVLTDDDPFTIIDLDDKPHNPAPQAMKQVHADIIANADTYIERSVSETGYHIVVIGQTPRPLKTPHIEMYSSLRFMICTGFVVKDSPIADGQTLIDLVIEHFGASNTYVDPAGQLPELAPGIDEEADEVIIQRGLNAENGDKFQALWEGDLSLNRGDHSAADSALLNLLCFLTPHNSQVRRIFKQSGLYRADRSNRGDRYLNYSIHKWRAENVPLDLTQYSINLQEGASRQPDPEPIELEPMPSAPAVAKVPTAPHRAPTTLFPPGIIGELAQYAFATSYNPVAEGALAAAIGYAAGLIGRGFHINRLGLNQYIVFIADSGVGKEGGKRAIRAVHAQVIAKVPNAQYNLGSSDFSAGVSMVKELADNPCMLGVAGEIGMTLRIMLDVRAPGHIKELKRALTDTWSESGPNGLLNSRKYSDRTKNGKDVQRPCLSLLGESVPSHFYGSLSDETANDGFIPRFIVIEYKGTRPYPNRDAVLPPPPALIDRLTDLYVASKAVQDSNQMVAIKLSPEAKAAFIRFEDSIIERVRALPVEHPIKAILNRTNEKALKLAGLLAACDNPYVPCVSLEQAQWAMEFAEFADGHMIDRFSSGEVGEGEQVYDSLVRKAIKQFQGMTEVQKLAAKVPKCALNHPVIPHSYLHDYLKRRAEIKAHRNGMNTGVKVAIEEAVMTGVLVRMSPGDRVKIGLRSDGYVLGDGW